MGDFSHCVYSALEACALNHLYCSTGSMLSQIYRFLDHGQGSSAELLSDAIALSALPVSCQSLSRIMLH